MPRSHFRLIKTPLPSPPSSGPPLAPSPSSPPPPAPGATDWPPPPATSDGRPFGDLLQELTVNRPHDARTIERLAKVAVGHPATFAVIAAIIGRILGDSG